MTWWIDAGQYATEALAIVLIFRLLWLGERREQVYNVFIAFLGMQLLETLIYLGYDRWAKDWLDYRTLWVGFTIVTAGFSLWIVYTLAKAILAELPGISRFSRNFLNVIFPLAIGVAFVLTRGEFESMHHGRVGGPMDKLVYVFFLSDRAIAMAAVVVLLIILGFILWFPVRMAKNLAFFSVGFVVYFASKTGLALLRTSATKNGDLATIGMVASIILVACFVYWIIFIDPKGQTTTVRLGHGWRVGEQRKLLDQLESINGALLRGSQRMEL